MKTSRQTKLVGVFRGFRVAGLVVAIPSLVGYNLLTGTIRQLTVMMDNFIEEFMVCVKLSQLKFQDQDN